MSTAVIVGGAGAMGRWAVRAVAQLGSVDRLLIADIDVARAARLALEVGGRCEAVKLDATDDNNLREVFASCDVVLNTMGPFSLFGHRVLEAALDCGCDYLDIDDDWESTVAALKLDARAKEQGCAVVKGIGGSPGVSNLCAAVAAQRLDTVHELFTGWSMRHAVIEEESDYPTQGSGAAVEHWLIQISGHIRSWRECAPADTVALEPVRLEYPGLGVVEGYTVGHPEAVTLPRQFPSLQRSINVTSGPAWLFEHARSVAEEFENGALTLSEGAAQLDDPPRPTDPGPKDILGQVWAVAYGSRNGRELAVSVEPTAMPPGRMGGGTGIALAVGLELWRRGSLTRPGVHTPESIVDPTEFFALYSEFVQPKRTGADLLLVRETADPERPSILAVNDDRARRSHPTPRR